MDLDPSRLGFFEAVICPTFHDSVDVTSGPTQVSDSSSFESTLGHHYTHVRKLFYMLKTLLQIQIFLPRTLQVLEDLRFFLEEC